MSRFVRIALAGAALAAPFGAYAGIVRPWMRRWGADATEAATLLPGDDIIGASSGQETRGITIDAAPEDVWPWLLQMGFGRGGWYSYDQLDMEGRSVDEIHTEWQTLGVGDVMPTHPGGGFEVRVLEPLHALSLYLDTEIGRQQAEAFQAAAQEGAASGAVTQNGEASAAATWPRLRGGMALSGMAVGTQPEQFAASWTFVVRRTPEGSTRLIERVRFAYPPQAIMGRLATEAFGFGVFLMMRKQMLGLRARAERLARASVPAPWIPGTGAPAPA